MDELRAHDQSRAVARRLGQAHEVVVPTPRSFQTSVTTRARESFYLYYVTSELGRCWKFLQPYHSTETEQPAHLSSAIDALSLAYLWHEVASDSALLAAMQSYVLALRQTRDVLSRPGQKIDRSTVLAALVLDIVEKILSSSSRPPSTHVDGALGLVKVLGIGNFWDSHSIPIILVLTNQAMIGSLALQQPIHPHIVSWRTWLEAEWRPEEHPTGVTALFVRYAELQHQFHANRIASDGFAWECYGMDAEVAMLEMDMPAFWQYQTVEIDVASHEQFGHWCHVYAHRNICQARNLIRVCRLLLNEAVLEHCPPHAINSAGAVLEEIARMNISHLATEICASVAQFADCRTHAARRTKPHASEQAWHAKANHGHTSTHIGDCYTLIFPSYAAARSEVPGQTRDQIIRQLHYIADHFCIRNAKEVAQLLERRQCPPVWDMYAKLGSYAFHM